MSGDESGAVILSPQEDAKGLIRLSVHIHFDGAGVTAGYASRSGRASGWVLPVIVAFGVAAAVWFGGRAVATRLVDAKLGAPSAGPAATFATNGGERPGEMPQALANALKEPPVVSPGAGVKSGQPSGPAAFGLE